MTARTSTATGADGGREGHMLTGVSPNIGRFMLTKPAKIGDDGSERSDRSHKTLGTEAVVTSRYPTPIMRRRAVRAGQDGTVDRGSGGARAAASGRMPAAAGTPLLRTGARGRAASSAFQVDRARDAWATPPSGRLGICVPPSWGPSAARSQISQHAEERRTPRAMLTRTVA